MLLVPYKDNKKFLLARFCFGRALFAGIENHYTTFWDNFGHRCGHLFISSLESWKHPNIQGITSPMVRAFPPYTEKKNKMEIKKKKELGKEGGREIQGREGGGGGEREILNICLMPREKEGYCLALKSWKPIY